MRILRKLSTALLMSVFSISNPAFGGEIRCFPAYEGIPFHFVMFSKGVVICLYMGGGHPRACMQGHANSTPVSGDWRPAMVGMRCSIEWGGTAQSCVFTKGTEVSPVLCGPS